MILNITTITTHANTAVTTLIPMDRFANCVTSATTLTCKYADAANAVKGVVFTPNGVNAAEKQLNVNKLRDWFAQLMDVGRTAGNVANPITYVADVVTIPGQAGLKFTGSANPAIETTTVAV